MSNATRRGWSQIEDAALRQLLQENLGAQFTEIAKKAVEPGGPFEDRTFWAVMNRLGHITGRRKARPPQEETAIEAVQAPLHEIEQLAIPDVLPAEDEKVKRINLAMDPELFVACNIMARASGKSMTAFINQILSSYVQKNANILKAIIQLTAQLQEN